MSRTKMASYQITDEEGDKLIIMANETGHVELTVTNVKDCNSEMVYATLDELERALADIRSRLFHEARTFDPEAYRQPGGVHG